LYLAKEDYRLLKFVKNNQPVPVDIVSKRFGKDITMQIDILRQHSFVKTKYKAINLYNESLQKDLHIYSVTQKGLDALNKHEQDNKLLLKKIFWYPLIIALVSAIVGALISKFF
jgi:hypothetical protein